MKWPMLIIIVATFALQAGCATSVKEARLNLWGGNFEQLSSEHKRYIKEGKVIVGMTREEVYLSLGVPETIIRGREAPDVKESWIYCCPGGRKLEVSFRRDKVVSVANGDR